MVILPGFCPGVVQAHPVPPVGGSAEGLPIEEIAPAAHRLADEKAQQHHIQHRGQLQMPEPAIYRNAHNGPQHTAVNGQTTLPDVQDGDRVIGVGLPGKNHIIQPGADNGKGGHPQNAVKNVILGQTELPAAAGAVQHRQNQPQGNGQSIQMDGQGAQSPDPGRIHFQPQGRKGDGTVIQWIHDSFPPSFSRGYTTDRLHRSGRITRSRKSRISPAVMLRYTSGNRK